jgi:hypothetical protein
MAEKSSIKQADTAEKAISDDEDLPEVSHDDISEKELLDIKKMVVD